MKTTLALIGFSAYTLCTALCPTNMSAMPMDHGVEHKMHMAAMEHETSEAACENCEDHSDQELALAPGNSFMEGNTKLTTHATSLWNVTIADPPSSIIRTHLAAADPPLVPTIVKTVVLRV